MCFFSFTYLYKIISILKKNIMKSKKRINMVVDEDIYDQIKKNADSAHLRIGTFARLLVIEALENNFIFKFNENEYGHRI